MDTHEALMGPAGPAGERGPQGLDGVAGADGVASSRRDMSAHELRLGDEVVDGITGLRGTVTGIAHYITGCSQVSVQPAGKPNELPSSHWLDVDRLLIVQAVTETRLAALLPGAAPDETPTK